MKNKKNVVSLNVGQLRSIIKEVVGEYGPFSNYGPMLDDGTELQHDDFIAAQNVVESLSALNAILVEAGLDNELAAILHTLYYIIEAGEGKEKLT